eukprot:3354555-Amphidinium_carterae.1
MISRAGCCVDMTMRTPHEVPICALQRAHFGQRSSWAAVLSVVKVLLTSQVGRGGLTFESFAAHPNIDVVGHDE